MIQRIAIPSNEGILWQHFGKAPQVTIFNVEDEVHYNSESSIHRLRVTL